MKIKLPFSLLLVLVASAVYSQKKYQPNWESLDSRPTPAWFEEAKFGIFIHWGPYSVPAWSPKGTYSEWYQYWMQTKGLFGNGDFKGDEVYNYHVKTYGKDFDYYQFGEQFTADLFDPDQWAALFEEAGAKYVVLTSKHHDGYTLWPNKQANDRGFAWNSVETGSKRDLLGDLTAAVKKTDVKMGLYYSLYEWFHPWWQNDRPRFVTDHFHPQFKDLIESYQPDIIWGDGEWDMPAEEWKTPELLTWLFNESSVKDKIVINDRWGKGIRKKHGGYFTTEYEAGATFDNPWEECRGMGFSFGYNQNEDAEDYNSPQTLILMLVNVVSGGGNLLLDIGPDGRGKIPTIMQERLRQMGGWLKINGEAIYGTKTWKKPFQWSAEGQRDFKPEKQHYTGGDFILKQTVDPEPGYAVKEAFFTQKAGNLYVITPRWPDQKLLIRDVNATPASKVTLLSTKQELKWENQGKDLLINMPAFDPNIFSEADHYAFVFKITETKP